MSVFTPLPNANNYTPSSGFGQPLYQPNFPPNSTYSSSNQPIQRTPSNETFVHKEQQKQPHNMINANVQANLPSNIPTNIQANLPIQTRAIPTSAQRPCW
jgi:hypothetical protein